MNRDSGVNRDIKRRFVEREVIACITDLGERLFGYEFDCWQNINDETRIHEYWIVTPWLGARLEEQGEATYEWMFGWIW
jgi:hypothetical protein